MANDANRNPVLRFFNSDGIELQPLDLKSIALPSSIINSMVGNSMFPVADMIDVKEFVRLERQRAMEQSAYLLANRPVRRPLAKFIGDGDVPRFTPQQCQLKCDFERDMSLTGCDRDAGTEGILCTLGTVGLAEVPLVAAGFAAWCGQRTLGRLAECRENTYRRHYNCGIACN